VPHTKQEYEKLVNFLDDLIDEVGEKKTHPLASLMEIISILIEYYEKVNIPELI
jgi:HTH-type transcriptional regulator/antitoxin HigA